MLPARILERLPEVISRKHNSQPTPNPSQEGRGWVSRFRKLFLAITLNVRAALLFSCPARIFLAGKKCSILPLLLNDSVEAGVASMDDRVRIRIREREIARHAVDERCPDRGRTQISGELHRVELAGHAEPSDGVGAAAGCYTRDDRNADPHGQVVNHHGPDRKSTCLNSSHANIS